MSAEFASFNNVQRYYAEKIKPEPAFEFKETCVYFLMTDAFDSQAEANLPRKKTHFRDFQVSLEEQDMNWCIKTLCFSY